MQDIAGVLGNISKTPLKEDRGMGGGSKGEGVPGETPALACSKPPPA